MPIAVETARKTDSVVLEHLWESLDDLVSERSEGAHRVSFILAVDGPRVVAGTFLTGLLVESELKGAFSDA